MKTPPPNVAMAFTPLNKKSNFLFGHSSPFSLLYEGGSFVTDIIDDTANNSESLRNIADEFSDIPNVTDDYNNMPNISDNLNTQCSDDLVKTDGNIRKRGRPRKTPFRKSDESLCIRRKRGRPRKTSIDNIYTKNSSVENSRDDCPLQSSVSRHSTPGSQIQNIDSLAHNSPILNKSSDSSKISQSETRSNSCINHMYTRQYRSPFITSNNLQHTNNTPNTDSLDLAETNINTKSLHTQRDPHVDKAQQANNIPSIDSLDLSETNFNINSLHKEQEDKLSHIDKAQQQPNNHNDQYTIQNEQRDRHRPNVIFKSLSQFQVDRENATDLIQSTLNCIGNEYVENCVLRQSNISRKNGTNFTIDKNKLRSYEFTGTESRKNIEENSKKRKKSKTLHQSRSNRFETWGLVRSKIRTSQLPKQQKLRKSKFSKLIMEKYGIYFKTLSKTDHYQNLLERAQLITHQYEHLKDNPIIALATFSKHLEFGFVEVAFITTNPYFRRMGYGKLLLNHLCSYCVQQGLSNIVLYADGGTGAVTFFEKYGFIIPTKSLPKLLYHDWIDRFSGSKFLTFNMCENFKQLVNRECVLNLQKFVNKLNLLKIGDYVVILLGVRNRSNSPSSNFIYSVSPINSNIRRHENIQLSDNIDIPLKQHIMVDYSPSDFDKIGKMELKPSMFTVPCETARIIHIDEGYGILWVSYIDCTSSKNVYIEECLPFDSVRLHRFYHIA